MRAQPFATIGSGLADSMTARANIKGSLMMPDIRLQALRYAINIETA